MRCSVIVSAYFLSCGAGPHSQQSWHMTHQRRHMDYIRGLQGPWIERRMTATHGKDTKTKTPIIILHLDRDRVGL